MTTADPPSCSELVTGLLAAADPALALRAYAADLQTAACADDLAAGLKRAADHSLRTDLNRARQAAKLLFDLAERTQNPLYRALGLRAQGNIHMIGEYDCLAAITLYEEAAGIYKNAGRPIEAAQSQVGKVGCLFFLGRYEEALTVGETARRILSQHAQWGSLTGLLLNLASIHRRLGQGSSALALLDEARTICQQTRAAAELPGIELNRANVLCDMGRLRAALQAGQLAESMFAVREQQVGAARARMSQGITCFLLGRYNDALTLFDQARVVYVADGRHTDALLVDRFASDLLLQLGRFTQVIAKCAELRTRYLAHDIPYEVAQAIRNEAVAYAGLGQSEKALASLADARALLADNPARAAEIDLETAVILGQQQRHRESMELATVCRRLFGKHDLRIRAAQADLVVARAAFALDQPAQTEALCRGVLDVARQEEVPWLGTQAHHLLAQAAHAHGRLSEAIAAYEQSIAQLEAVRGHLMVELRVDFLLNKQQVYEDMSAAYLQAGQAADALQTAERAKSRALTELLANHLDLRIAPRQTRDQKLLDELSDLRTRRNQLYSQWQATQDHETQTEIRSQIVGLETELATRWQTLLVRNADYARDAGLLHGYAQTVPLPLDSQTLLVEFFSIRGELIVFLVNQERVVAQPLPGVLAQLVQPARLLNLNLKAMTAIQPAQAAHLEQTSQKYLAQLYQRLIAPIQDRLAGYSRLIIVPHGALLHYLPFAALFDGRHYLAEHHAISYLPNATLLHHLPQRTAPVGKAAVFGFSAGELLPHATHEAQRIASLLNGDAYLEEAATVAQLQAVAAQAPIIHLAAHADFNRENPLFSGLRLADGQLTTLDLFHLRINASLVTLSACETGRSVVGGGDELLGLMRALLYAGAGSLLLTHWRVRDQSTMVFMLHFYEKLRAGISKAEALRQAQLALIHGDESLRHPAYWAAFFLVGAGGPIYPGL